MIKGTVLCIVVLFSNYATAAQPSSQDSFKTQKGAKLAEQALRAAILEFEKLQLDFQRKAAVASDQSRKQWAEIDDRMKKKVLPGEHESTPMRAEKDEKNEQLHNGFGVRETAQKPGPSGVVVQYLVNPQYTRDIQTCIKENWGDDCVIEEVPFESVEWRRLDKVFVDHAQEVKLWVYCDDSN